MINLNDGLDFDEVLQVLRWIDISRLLNPSLHSRLLTTANSGLSIVAAVQNPPFSFFLGMLPGNIAGQLNNIADVLQMCKTALEVPPR